MNNLYGLPCIIYDNNGNIKEMQRWGLTGPSSYGLMDLLVYFYEGNRIIGVNDPEGIGGWSDNGYYYNPSYPATTEFFYDENGNMIQDLNKGIIEVVYNYLNLPEKIEFDNNKRIRYVYDASGNKLRKYYYEDNRLMYTIDYVGNIVYKDYHIDYILTSEGRLKRDGDISYNAEYFIKDHLGNVRACLTTDSEQHFIAQVTDYYPFGQEIHVTGTQDNQIKYNSKELQTENGLNWYDYGARYYDPQLGRWHVVDPMCNRHYDWTPYAYVLNNPIANIDIYGFTDWKAVMKGSAMFVGGLASVIGGVAAASTPTGIGQYAGGAAIVTGVPTMGVGIGMIAAGIKDDGTAQKIPTGPGETAGLAADKLMGNENNELRTVGNTLDLGISIVTANPNSLIEEVAFGVDVAISIDDLTNSDNTTSESNTEQANQQSNNETANPNGIDLVLGQHLQSSDPDYWNSLTDGQRSGYNADRVSRYEGYLINENR